MEPTFKKGDRVIVNTGGNDTIAYIDDPTIPYDRLGKLRPYVFEYEGELIYLCRFTDDFSKTYTGGAKYERWKGDHTAANNTLVVNAQFIDGKSIRLADK